MSKAIIPEIIGRRDLNKKFNVENKTLNFNFDIKNKNILNKNKVNNKTINNDNRSESIILILFKFIKSILTLPFYFIRDINNKYQIINFIDSQIKTHKENKQLSEKTRQLNKCFKKNDEIL